MLKEELLKEKRESLHWMLDFARENGKCVGELLLIIFCDQDFLNEKK